MVSLPDCSPTVMAGLERARGYLKDAGYVVEESQLPEVERAAGIAGVASMAALAAEWEAVAPLMSQRGRHHMELMIDLIGPVSAADLSRAHDDRTRIAGEWSTFRRRFPLMLAPVCTEPPFAVGFDLTSSGLARIVRSMTVVLAVNVLGLPAVVVPVGVEEGVPQVAQIIGGPFDDYCCLDAAETIELAAGRWKPIDPIW